MSSSPSTTSLSPQLLNSSGMLTSEHFNTPPPAHGQDWSCSLVHLAKTAELRKHALDLQLHTAHILAAHASLEDKNRTLQDVKEQQNRLESERNKLIAALSQINEDRTRLEGSLVALDHDCSNLRSKIQRVSDGEYAESKKAVDRLRIELGQPPLPSLQSILDERAAAYLTARRLKGPQSTPPSQSPPDSSSHSIAASNISYTPSLHRNPETGEPPLKRSRGRPKGSKNKPKTGS